MRIRRNSWSPRRIRSTEEVPRDEPAEDELEIHDLLVNWGEWCVGRRAQGRAGSAEGGYRPPALNVYNPPDPMRRVDVPKAEAVNTALLSVHEPHRPALVLRYYLRVSDRGICGALGLEASFYPRFMRDSRLLLRASLHFLGFRLIMPPTTSADKTAKSAVGP